MSANRRADKDVLHFPGEVGGVLVLDGDVAIAGDAEGGGGGDGFAREKLARVGGDEVFDEDESMAFALDGDIHAPAEDVRHGNERVADRLGLGIEQAAGDGDLQRRNDGRRSVGIDGERREQRKNGVFKRRADLRGLGDGEVATVGAGGCRLFPERGRCFR